MTRQVFPASQDLQILVENIGGSLEARGWDRSEVEIQASPETSSIVQQGEVLRLRCDASCTIRLPHDTTVQVETVYGNAHLRGLKQPLKIHAVHGSLTLRELAAVQVETVFGELVAKDIAGDLHVQRVMGNSVLRRIGGQCELDELMGNLDLRDVQDDIKIQAEGNARLRLSVIDGDVYHIQAEGEVYCHIPEDANLTLHLRSDAEMIKVRLSGEVETYRAPTHEILLGDGTASMTLSAGGALYLFGQKADWEESASFSPDVDEQISQQIEKQIEEQMAEINRQINEQMARLSERIGMAGLSPAETERIMQHAMRASERESARAQEKMRRAQEKLERKLEAARRRSEMRAQTLDRRTRPREAFGIDWSAPAPPAPPVPPASVTDQERLTILRMLEQKKISLQEAERLLAALEGENG